MQQNTAAMFDIEQNTYWDGVVASLDTCHSETTFLFCLLSFLCWCELQKPLLPSHHVPESGAVCHSVFYIC
jgi:hypothetical protein